MNRDEDSLLDILDLIQTILRHQPETVEALLADEVLHTAILHWLQTIGGAANRVSDELQARHPDVPWRGIIDMRNLVAHGYDIVELDIVWEVVVRDLPKLSVQVSEIVKNLKPAAQSFPRA